VRKEDPPPRMASTNKSPSVLTLKTMTTLTLSAIDRTCNPARPEQSPANSCSRAMARQSNCPMPKDSRRVIPGEQNPGKDMAMR